MNDLLVLLADPLQALHSERLLRDHRGLRSARFGWRFRLLFKLCGECRLHRDQARYTLECCLAGDAETTPDNTINILYLSDHYGDTPADFRPGQPSILDD